MIMPNFLIIGAAKSGTTALYAYLSQHPEIYMSSVKEPRFFAFEGETLNFKGPGNQADSMNQQTITDLKTYQALFDGVVHEKAIGEASPAYLCVPKASERIQYYIPDVKLITILRHPAERAYSSFLHTVRNGYEPLRDFSQVLQEEEKRINNHWEFIWHHKALGYYYPQLKRYYERFDRQQMKIYLYDDLCDNLTGLMQDIFKFLGVDDTFIPNTADKINASGIPKSRWLFDLIYKNSPIKSVVKFVFPGDIRQPIVQTMKSWNMVKPTIPPEIRKQLVMEYRDDILKLQDLIQRDLSQWLE